MPSFAMKRVLRFAFDEALARIPEALKTEGFGVLTEIDANGTLSKKVGTDSRRCRILGACNAPLERRVREADLDVSVLLPCNVVVYEGDDGRAVVSAIDPTTTPAASASTRLHEVAETVRDKLARVLDRLE